MAQLLNGVTLIKHDLSEVPAEEALEGKVVGLYFSAGWCPPCRQFTPKLVKLYKALKESGKNFEVVFVTKDRAKPDMEEYFQDHHGEWVALQYGDDRIARYCSKYEIKTLPQLRIIKADGTVAVADGRADVNEKGKEDPNGLYAKWEAAVA